MGVTTPLMTNDSIDMNVDKGTNPIDVKCQ